LFIYINKMSFDLKKKPAEQIQQQQQPLSQPPTQNQIAVQTPSQRLPSEVTFQNAGRLAIGEDKPILLDYWMDSLDGKALIGVRENNEKMLVKSAEEYTSPIAKLYRSGSEYIVMTENSIYIVSSTITSRRIA
jgi:hypothetical protein